MQFFIAFTFSEGLEGSRWITDRLGIAKHYLRTWFAIDVASIVVSIIDIQSLDDESSTPSNLRAVRVLRALRLIKLIRLVRASRMFKR